MKATKSNGILFPAKVPKVKASKFPEGAHHDLYYR